jgi:hypothetical protein
LEDVAGRGATEDRQDGVAEKFRELIVPGSPLVAANSSFSWAVHAASSCYDEPDNPMTFPAPVPEIPAANVDKAAAYYVNTLGFTFDWGDDQGGIAGISRGVDQCGVVLSLALNQCLACHGQEC